MSSTSKCGFCNFISSLLNRAMCVSSRPSSSESYYRDLGDQDTLKIEDRVSESSVELSAESSAESSADSSTEFDVLFPKVTRVPRPKEPESIDDIIANLDEIMSTKRILTGKFLTLRKRSKHRLVTRSLSKEKGLLDDLLPGQVQCILEQSATWNFNAFTLDTVSGGKCLTVLCVHLFHVYGLISHFKLDVTKVWKLFSLIEEGYHSTNPYHNSVHAADVTQAMHCFLQQKKISEHMEPLEIMASLLAAITHDLDHPGVSQPFLIATSNHLADLYENTSVLENHHWRSAVSCITESGLFDNMQEQRPRLEHQICSLILATDITRQQEYLGHFKSARYRGDVEGAAGEDDLDEDSPDLVEHSSLETHLDTNSLDMTKPEHRHLVLQIALKCADISNPCRPWEISKKWSLKVCEEFFRQGDYERKLNIPVTALCDRNATSIPKIQTGFFRFVVTPLITEWHRFLKNDLSAQMLHNLIYNQNKWEALLAEEIAEEAFTYISDAELVDDDLETNTAISESSELLIQPPRRASLNAVGQRQQGLREHLRRFSVPLNLFQDIKMRGRQGRSSPEAAAAQQPDNNGSSAQAEHSELRIAGRCDSQPIPEKLNGAATEPQTRRRQSMPAEAEAVSSSHPDRRVLEMREVLPELLRTAAKDYLTRRRGSAPVTSETRGTRCRPNQLPCQLLARTAPRRSSLPVEVMPDVSSH